MTPEQALARREDRLDALISRVESGDRLTADDWSRLAELNTLDVMSVESGAARELLELERLADNGQLVD